MKTKKIKVALAFSNNLISIGIHKLLHGDSCIEVANIITSGTDCPVSRFKTLSENVVLTDFTTLYNSFPLPEHVEKWPSIILLDTNCGIENIISAFFRKKLCGILTSKADSELLLKSIKMVAKGEIWIDNKTLKLLLDGVNTTEGGKKAILSGREEEIVNLTGSGYRNKEIAKKLNISESTVKTHLYRIFQKLNIRTRYELVAFAVRHGEPESRL